jgi:hypothetical protein
LIRIHVIAGEIFDVQGKAEDGDHFTAWGRKAFVSRTMVLRGRREFFVVRIEMGGTVAVRDTHLSDDEAVAKMGHPDLWKG